MIFFKDLKLTQGNKVLFENANIQLYTGMKVGLVGRNGCGKSSLFAAIKGNLDPALGELEKQKNIAIAYIEQETPALMQPAIEYTIEGDRELAKINAELKKAEESEDYDKVIMLHEKIANIDGYAAEAKAAKILAGLGITEEQQQKSVKEFSGGWRMRINIARCLMSRSDLLLLDEPTNHLDLSAITWLEKWLQKYPGCIILISHDREFLDRTVDNIINIAHKTCKLYKGNYSQYEIQKAEAIKLQNSLYQKQQEKIDHLMSYVNRFRAKASKAKQAQSRLKSIDKLEKITMAQFDSPFQFEFLEPKKQPSPIIHMQNVNCGYGDTVILKKVNMSIAPHSRIGLIGENGAGKSTLVKTLAGIIEPLDGSKTTHSHAKIGYFDQHNIDYLDLSKSPIELIKDLDRTKEENKIRSFLGGFDFRDDMAKKTIAKFSGGEKSRLALAMIIWQQPNLLLLDEPTNHLDMEVRTALSIALQSFSGAVIIVSHDRHLLKTTANDLYLIQDSKVSEFSGDVDDYLSR